MPAELTRYRDRHTSTYSPPRRHSGQPAPPRRGRLVRWLVVGPAALVAIAAILVGAPWALLALAGNPLPGGMYAPSELVSLLTTPDDGRLLLWAIAVAGWLAWAAVASSLLLELGAQLAGRHTPQLPGLSGPQRLASLLVAAALASMSAPAVASAAYVDTEIHASQHEPEALPRGAAEPTPIVHTVQRGEGLVDIAERYQVTVERLAIANHHRQQPDGLSLRPGELRVYPGWQLRIPATAVDDSAQLVHEVAKGDWMWHIAGRYLGDEQRYPEIAELNPDLAAKYQNYPDHIQPGDLLTLPPDATDSGERRHATGAPVGESAPAPPDEEEPEPAPPEDEEPEPAPPDAEEQPPPPAAPPEDEEELHLPPEPGPPPAPAPDPTPEPAPSPAPAPEATQSPEQTQPTTPPVAAAPPPEAPGAPGAPGQAAPGEPPLPPGQAPDPDPVADVDAGSSGWGPLAAAGVLASVLLGAILIYRWRKHARRRPGRIVVDATAAPAESNLRAAANVDIARLDRALRLLTEAGSTAVDDTEHRPGDPGPVPDVGAVWVADGDIHLILAGGAGAEPPPPFHVSDSGTWVLPAEAELPEPAGGMAPLPALVTIASHPGEHLLVDLERVGMLTIGGDPERTSDLLRHVVAELACNPWSELLQITLAGFPREQARQLAALNPLRIQHAESLPVAVEMLRRRLAFTTGALEAHGLPDALYGRIGDTATDTWIPQLLLVNQPGPEHDELLSYLEGTISQAGRRCAVAVATAARAGAPYGRRPVTIDDDGLLTASFLEATRPIPAAGLPADVLGPLVGLVTDAATGPDHPVPPATEPWAAGTDATGDYLPGSNGGNGALLGNTPVRPLPALRPVGEAPEGIQPEEGIDPDRLIPAGVDPDRLIPAGVDPAGVDPAGVDPAAFIGVDAEVDLDEAVAAWWHGADQPPRLAVLGPVEVTAPGQPPSQRVRVCQELVVLLAACGEAGADAGEITRKLWPSRQVPATARTELIMSVRRWLGTDRDGEQWLSEAVPDGRYRLRDGLLVDWYLFRQLRARGIGRGLDGAADLGAALCLVRGAPLADTDRLGGSAVRVPYSWLPGTPFAPELMLAGILDTAHQLVGLSLATGDLETARWAVQRAWLADPQRADDLPWQDLLWIADAQRDPGQVRSVVAELLSCRGAEHPDELAPATRELVISLLAGADG